MTTARAVKEAGATMLRGGAFKPRTSPYAFQGLEADGIKLLLKAREETGLPIVTEIMGEEDLPLFEDIDVIQVGARNMQNFKLLKALGKVKKPILLKRGLSSTIEELLMSAEYIAAGGNTEIILCERGIRTFETMTRNTLDISAVSLLKQKSHLPVCADPSHATGILSLIEPMSLSLIVAGADMLEIEVHCTPANALSDGSQQLTPAAFSELMGKIKGMAEFLGREIG
jgi:3-deoxy-7-phosphoheptulonate synthase